MMTCPGSEWSRWSILAVVMLSIARERICEGEPGPVQPGDEVDSVLTIAQALGWTDESSFFQWLSNAPAEQVHEAGQFIVDMYP